MSESADNATTKKVPVVTPTTVDSQTEFPEARVNEAAPGLMRLSRMWWMTLACLIMAVLLAWNSMPATGPQIAIHFPEGHGLKAGDTVRYRGIEVGNVTDVLLNEDLSGIDVTVTLTPGGGALDREGTRFWIVRPRFSLTEVSGLETAVGAKYIGVSPGDPNGAHRREFDGLASAPPDELDHGGLEIILRSDDRHGTSAGAPVTWRGVDAGKVLSVNLSPDARHVHITVRIDRAYRKLVRPSSKFWVNSGFGVDVGLTGVKLNAKSLTTILQGGVSFVTLTDGSGAGPVSDGHVFALASKAEDEWLEAGANIPLIDFPLPETVLIRSKRDARILGFSRKKEVTQAGLLVADSGGTLLVTAAFAENAADDDSMPELHVQAPGVDPLTVNNATVSLCKSLGTGLTAIPVSGLKASQKLTQFRTPVDPEDCLVVRSALVDGQSTPLIQAIDLEQLSPQDGNWAVQSDSVDFSEWHGAPVLAMDDGKIIGVLLTSSGSPTVAIYRP